jgi:tetratricopeptide (TPR) repeat protein
MESITSVQQEGRQENPVGEKLQDDPIVNEEINRGRLIEACIAEEDWNSARKLIEEAILQEPDNHWLLARLSLTYYEQRDYQRALELSAQALAIQPLCPLALWDHASSLDALGKPKEALVIYKGLVERGVEELAFGECGEGIAWSRGLLADCLYCMSKCYTKLGEYQKAVEHLKEALAERGPGCRSIYPISTLRKKLKEFEAKLELKEQRPVSPC